MTEETLKIRVEELSTIRLVFDNGVVHEMPIEQAKGYSDVSTDPTVQQALAALVKGVQFFSKKGDHPSIEFVISMKR